MTLDATAQAFLEQIRQAKNEGRLTENRAEIDLETAYRIQAELHPDRVLKGYKLAFQSTDEQVRGVMPVFGRVYEDMLLESPVQLKRFAQPRIMPALAVLVEDLSPDATPGTAYSSVRGVFLAVEFLDSVWRGDVGVSHLVADNASGGGFLIGERPLDDVAFQEKLRLSLDGRVRTEASIHALENLSAMLQWLAAAVRGLQLGQIVFLGALTAALVPRRGTLVVEGPKGSALIAQMED
jgi:2-keto-4-pentenoate hydratase